MAIMTHNVKVNRSAVYYLMNTIAPINHRVKAKFDVVGSVIVISLLIGGLSLMRFLLDWTI